MKTYTFEQILNERIREYEELKREAESLKDLVEFNEEKYKYSGAAHSLSYSNSVIMWYDRVYKNALAEKLDDLKYFIKYRIIEASSNWYDLKTKKIYFCEHDPIKKQYKDEKDQTILTIKNPDEFKEKLDAFFTSPLVKEIKKFDGKVKTIQSTDYNTMLIPSKHSFQLYDKNVFINFFDNTGVLIQNPVTMDYVLNLIKETKFKSDNFSDYFRERLERDTDKDFSIELDPNCEYPMDSNGKARTLILNKLYNTSWYNDGEIHKNVENKLILTGRKL